VRPDIIVCISPDSGLKRHGHEAMSLTAATTVLTSPCERYQCSTHVLLDQIGSLTCDSAAAFVVVVARPPKSLDGVQKRHWLMLAHCDLLIDGSTRITLPADGHVC